MAEAPRDTVAIVDDDEAVRHSLRFLLEVIGCKVETFASAVNFLKADLNKMLCLILLSRKRVREQDSAWCGAIAVC